MRTVALARVAIIMAAACGPAPASVQTNRTPSEPVPEPLYDPATDKLILTDNFDSYTGTVTGSSSFVSRYPNRRAVDRNDVVVPIENYVSLVSPGRGGSGQALRLAYGNPAIAGSTSTLDGAGDIVVGPEGRLGSVGAWNGTLPEVAGPYTHFLLTMWIRFSPGADPSVSHAGGVKGIMHWYNGGRYQHSPHRARDYGPTFVYPETRWDAGPPRPPNSYTGVKEWQTANGEAPRFSVYNDGNWHRATSEYWATGSGHIGVRWWLDGVLVIDNVDNVGDNHWGADYVYGQPITHWMVFGNFVNATAAQNNPAFTVDFDDWIAWTR